MYCMPKQEFFFTEVDIFFVEAHFLADVGVFYGEYSGFRGGVKIGDS